MRPDETQNRLTAKKYGLKFHSKFKYCTNSEVYDNDIYLQRDLKRIGLKLQYFDGCFLPYIVSYKKVTL